MLLKSALRIQPGQTVAFVGAGGKSSAIGRLGRELASTTPTIVTTTTRIGLEQTHLAAHHLISQGGQDLQRLPRLLEAHGSVLVTGPAPAGAGKWPGISESDQLRQMHAIATAHGAVILIEADGGRGRTLKAPADHEPVIPPFADLVVPVAGLDAVGAALDQETVHRAELVSKLAEADPGSTLGPTHLAQVLSSESGGLKGVPAAAEVRVLLNKAADPDRREAGRQIAAELLQVGRIRAVLLAEATSDPPVVETHGRVAGVVLAAGGSSRLGQPKQLIRFRGQPLVWHAVRAARDAGLSPVLVVCGGAGAEVRRALEGEPVSLVENPNWESGQSSSVRIGLGEAEKAGIEGAIFLLADMPLVGKDLVREILSTHRRTLAPLVAPRTSERRGNPVLFDRATFPALRELAGDRGGRSLFERYTPEWVEWDEAAMLDLDTDEDLRRLRQLE